MTLRVLHLASFDRWSGAAAPAFAEVEALRSEGVEAFFAFEGGYKLERKLAHVPYAFPIIARGQSPLATIRSVRAIRRLARELRIDLLHAHLTYDHQIAFLSGLPHVRTFHSRRPIRNDPVSRLLARRARGIGVVNASLLDAPSLQGRRVTVTPPPLDAREFHPGGPAVDAPGRPLLGAIGKMVPGRGFEDVLLTAREIGEGSVLLIGDGPHRPFLEALARSMGIAERVTFAGYHEEDLADHYRALDLLFFTAKGSDEGHRAILEAMACGVPVASYPIAGVAEIIGEELAPLFVADRPTPAALANRAANVLSGAPALRAAAVAATERFRFAPAAARLMEMYRRAG